MKTLLQLQKRRDEALSAVAAATTPTAKKDAVAALDAASLALAKFQARLGSKTTYVKEKERYESDEEEDEEEEEEEESSDDEPKKPLMKKGAKADEDEEDEESEEEEEDESTSSTDSTGSTSSSMSSDSSDSEGEEEKATLGAKTGLYTYHRLFRLCQQITGEQGVREVFGALDALGLKAKAHDKLSARVAKLEKRDRLEKVDALLSSARHDGKITKEAVPSLRAKGLNDPKWLRAHLDALPKRVRSIEDGPVEGESYAGDQEKPEQTRERVLSAQSMSKEQRKMVETFAMEAGVSVDEFIARMNNPREAAKKASASK